MKNLFLLSIFVMLTSLCQGQASTPGNAGVLGDYLGWDINTGIDLEIKHEGAFPITFFTNNVERMRLTPSGNLLVGQTTVGIPARLDVLGRNIAIRGIANSPNSVNQGGFFSASGGVDSYGAYGVATSNIIGSNYGLAGEACNGQTANYAVYGIACSNTNQNWAGYFDGKTFCTSGQWDASDENLKTNIAELENATAMLMNLSPKSYEFDQSIEAINLPEGLQYGLLAQELQEVIPHAVTDVVSPRRLDDEGNVAVESMEFKAVNYNQLIPVLIAGFKEQNQLEQSNMSAIADLQSRLNEVENKMAVATQLRLVEATEPEENLKKVKLDQNSPNPFENETLISYDILQSGQVRVDIVNDKGELIATLENRVMDTGSFSSMWNATGLADGIYFCIIRHDVEIQIKKMLKK
jgi:hypothetical protein